MGVRKRVPASQPARTGLWPCVMIPVLAGLASCTDDPASSPPMVRELAPRFAYASLFESQTGFATDPDHFGVYVIQPIGDTLYFGLSAGFPFLQDGAMLAGATGTHVFPVANLDEQGVMDMTVVSDTLLIAGVDPCCPDGWDSGNFYRYHPDIGLQKYRDLPDVLHGWGLWFDDASRQLYLAASAISPDTVHAFGQVWSSDDLGITWSLMAGRDEGVGAYRAYDIAGIGDRLFTAGADLRRGACRLSMLNPRRHRWDKVLGSVPVACLARLHTYQEGLVVLDSSLTALHVLPERGAAYRIDLPFTVPWNAPQWAVTVGTALYVLADEGDVFATNDLLQWTHLHSGPASPTSISYWPAVDRLVVATPGANATVWLIERP